MPLGGQVLQQPVASFGALPGALPAPLSMPTPSPPPMQSMSFVTPAANATMNTTALIQNFTMELQTLQPVVQVSVLGNYQYVST